MSAARRRRALAAGLLSVAVLLLSASPPAFAQTPEEEGATAPRRARITGTTLEDFELSISTDGIDWTDPAAVAGAAAQIQADFRAIEPIMERILQAEMRRYYGNIVAPELLQPLDQPGPAASRGPARLEMGLREDISPTEARFAYAVAMEGGSGPTQFRSTLRCGADGRWRIARAERGCFSCDGSGECATCHGSGTVDDGMGGAQPCYMCQGAKGCEMCDGAGYRADPPPVFPAASESPEPPEVARDIAASVARAVALGQHYLPARVIGVLIERMRVVFQAFCEAFFAPEAFEGQEQENPFAFQPQASIVSEETPGDGRARIVIGLDMTFPGGAAGGTGGEGAGEGEEEAPIATRIERVRVDLVRGEDGTWRASAIGRQCYMCETSGRCSVCHGSPPAPNAPGCGMCGGAGKCQECQGEGYQERSLGSGF